MADIRLIESHDCVDPNTCPEPEGFMFIATKSADGAPVETSVAVHGVSPSTVARALVGMWDEAGQEARPEHIPPMIAFAHFRELLRQAIESVDPPGEVLADIAALDVEDE